MPWPDAPALAGVRALDLCRVVSGPFATMQLGDLGADVLKVEEPGQGDESRTYGPPFPGGESAPMDATASAMRADGQAMLDPAAADDRQEFGSFFLARLLGMAVGYEADACAVTFDAVPLLFNAQGTLHGGVLATAMGISMGHLPNRAASPGATLGMKVRCMAPATAGPVRRRAASLRQGRSVPFLRSHARRAGGALAAHATATWRQLPAKA